MQVNCPFCRIKKDKTEIIKNGKFVFVCLSNPRLMPGHLLVIPRRHVGKISQLTTDERREIFNILIKFQEKILAKFASGCDIRQNYRPFIEQNWVKVDHVHFHLLPREFEDELYQKSMKYEKEIFKKLPEKERQKFVRLFKD